MPSSPFAHSLLYYRLKAITMVHPLLLMLQFHPGIQTVPGREMLSSAVAEPELKGRGGGSSSIADLPKISLNFFG